MVQSRGSLNDKTEKANEVARAPVSMIKKEGDIIVAYGSKSKLWRDMSLRQAKQNWNTKYVDIVRSPVKDWRINSRSTRLEKLENW